MYSKRDTAILKQQFWTTFGQYMAPVPSAEGVKINWINYKTGIKDLHFSMQADNGCARIFIQMSHTNSNRQSIFFDRFVQLKGIFLEALQEQWHWALLMQDENGKTVSRIYTTLNGISIANKADWPVIISFFKSRIVLLDGFWTNMKFVFEDL